MVSLLNPSMAITTMVNLTMPHPDGLMDPHIWLSPP